MRLESFLLCLLLLLFLSYEPCSILDQSCFLKWRRFGSFLFLSVQPLSGWFLFFMITFDGLWRHEVNEHSTKTVCSGSRVGAFILCMHACSLSLASTGLSSNDYQLPAD